MSTNSMSCNALDLNGEPYLGFDFFYDDQGDNECGCNGDIASCKVSSTVQQPPTPLTGSE